MGLDFRTAARHYADMGGETLGGNPGHPEHTDLGPTNRPVQGQPDVETDGLDPAAVGGPSPMNSGQGPYGAPVATDPELQTPVQPGGPVPFTPGPDLDTTTLH